MPLVLDLDGTLIAGDLLYKSFFSILRRNPLIVFSCAAWLLRGRAALKRQLALRNRIDWERLALHRDVLALARQRKSRRADDRAGDRSRRRPRRPTGSRASASSIRCSHRTASEISRDPRKPRFCSQKFPAGFIYAGDSKADLAVWARAAGIVLVNARKSVRVPR